jgi:beta-glucanase (GH16 family)
MNRLFIFVAGLFFLMNCSDDPNGSVASIKNQFYVLREDVKPEQSNITVELKNTVSGQAIFDYTLKEVGAVAGEDFVLEEGVITFPSGQVTQVLTLDIINDEHIEITEDFIVVLSEQGNPTNSQELKVTIENDDFTFELTEDADGYSSPNDYPSMQLVWQDEFDGASLNQDDWSYDIGDGCDQGICGWGNEELQDYTDNESNVFLENGHLIIKATKVSGGYNSGRILTADKQVFQYGRIDIRAKLPFGQGMWPALWMLGDNLPEVGWPRCGEIDIMEYRGQDTEEVDGTVHYQAGDYKYSSSKYILQGDGGFQDKFHVFTVLWDKDKISWYVDYKPFKTFDVSQVGNTYPFNAKFYFLINLAVGGRYVGSPDESTQFPQQLDIDYIRVFQ